MRDTPIDASAGGPPPVVPGEDMPVFLFVCDDGPDAPRLRSLHLAGHLAHVERHWRDLVVAGPLRPADGDGAIDGSAFLVRAADLASAWTMMRGDPYVASGLYRDIQVRRMRMAVGLFPGGRIWESAEALAAAAGASPGG